MNVLVGLAVTAAGFWLGAALALWFCDETDTPLIGNIGWLVTLVGAGGLHLTIYLPDPPMNWVGYHMVWGLFVTIMVAIMALVSAGVGLAINRNQRKTG